VTFPSLQLFPFSCLYLAPVHFNLTTHWFLGRSCLSLHKCVWGLALLKKGVMFSDDKHWFSISSTMTASFPATQAIWPAAFTFGPCWLRSEGERGNRITDAASIRNCSMSFREFKISTLLVDKCAFLFVCTVCVWLLMFSACIWRFLLASVNTYLAEILMVLFYIWHLFVYLTGPASRRHLAGLLRGKKLEI